MWRDSACSGTERWPTCIFTLRALQGAARHVVLQTGYQGSAWLTAGGPAYFVLVSWLYALYSFDYKWSLTSRRLQDRISFIEEHWAFFLGAPASPIT